MADRGKQSQSDRRPTLGPGGPGAGALSHRLEDARRLPGLDRRAWIRLRHAAGRCRCFDSALARPGPGGRFAGEHAGTGGRGRRGGHSDCAGQPAGDLRSRLRSAGRFCGPPARRDQAAHHLRPALARRNMVDQRFQLGRRLRRDRRGLAIPPGWRLGSYQQSSGLLAAELVSRSARLERPPATLASAAWAPAFPSSSASAGHSRAAVTTGLFRQSAATGATFWTARQTGRSAANGASANGSPPRDHSAAPNRRKPRKARLRQSTRRPGRWTAVTTPIPPGRPG